MTIDIFRDLDPAFVPSLCTVLKVCVYVPNEVVTVAHEPKPRLIFVKKVLISP
jgi:hypothetical protein